MSPELGVCPECGKTYALRFVPPVKGHGRGRFAGRSQEGAMVLRRHGAPVCPGSGCDPVETRYA